MSNVQARLLRAQQEHLVDQVMAHEQVAREFGMHLPELQLLHLLVLHPQIRTAGDLVERTGLSTSTVSNLIERLEREGFVSRHRDPRDRRRLILEPTPRCAQIATRYEDHEMAARMRQALEGFSEAEIAVVLRYFQGLNDARSTTVVRR